MAEFGKKEILNPFLKWLGVFLICVIFPFTVLYSGWIWALTIAGLGIISILTAMYRAFEINHALSDLKCSIIASLTTIAMVVLYIDVLMWHRTLILLALAVALLLFSFRNKR